jgi:hypothetical protein
MAPGANPIKCFCNIITITYIEQSFMRLDPGAYTVIKITLVTIAVT